MENDFSGIYYTDATGPVRKSRHIQGVMYRAELLYYEGRRIRDTAQSGETVGHYEKILNYDRTLDTFV